jgi:hypothetical protein
MNKLANEQMAHEFPPPVSSLRSPKNNLEVLFFILLVVTVNQIIANPKGS